jgi:hypothetical protein
MQGAATAHSAAQGWPLERYRAAGAGCTSPAGVWHAFLRRSSPPFRSCRMMMRSSLP